MTVRAEVRVIPPTPVEPEREVTLTMPYAVAQSVRAILAAVVWKGDRKDPIKTDGYAVYEALCRVTERDFNKTMRADSWVPST